LGRGGGGKTQSRGGASRGENMRGGGYLDIIITPKRLAPATDSKKVRGELKKGDHGLDYGTRPAIRGLKKKQQVGGGSHYVDGPAGNSGCSSGYFQGKGSI